MVYPLGWRRGGNAEKQDGAGIDRQSERLHIWTGKGEVKGDLKVDRGYLVPRE